MALTPDTSNETFLREVDENLRRDRMRDFAKRYGKWLIAGLVLFLAAIAGWIYWQDRQKQIAANQSEELSAIFQRNAGRRDGATRNAGAGPISSSETNSGNVTGNSSIGSSARSSG